jgi:hypothetical protein
MSGGAASIASAAAAARSGGMPYETFRCLAALLEVEAAGGPPAPAGTAEECAELQRALGLVAGRPLLPPR